MKRLFFTRDEVAGLIETIDGLAGELTPVPLSAAVLSAREKLAAKVPRSLRADYMRGYMRGRRASAVNGDKRSL
jgi:predicted DNA-binding transcriptional regulator YafY